MKKMIIAAVAIAMCVAVCSCNSVKKEEKKVPEGQKIGQLTLVEEKDTGVVTLVLYDKDGYRSVTDFTKIEDRKGFLVGYQKDGSKALMTPLGRTFCRCDSFEVKQQYAGSTKPVADSAKYVRAFLPTGNILAYPFGNLRNVAQVEGLKENVLVLDNGFSFYKQKGKWGIINNATEEPVLGAVCSSVGISVTPSTTYFWVNSPEYVGLIDEQGEAVKNVSAAALKRQGTKLWDEGAVFGYAVNAI